MGSIFETLKYDYPVTGLQFDTRKIVAATGENGIEVGPMSMCDCDPTLTFIPALQPDQHAAFSPSHERTHAADGATALHGQVSRLWRSRHHGQDMGPVALLFVRCAPEQSDSAPVDTIYLH